MKIQQFDLSAADEAALGLVRSHLEGLTGSALRLTNVDAVRYSIHRAAASIAATIAMDNQDSEGHHEDAK